MGFERFFKSCFWIETEDVGSRPSATAWKELQGSAETTGNAEIVQAAGAGEELPRPDNSSSMTEWNLTTGAKRQNGFGEAEPNMQAASGLKSLEPKRLSAQILQARSAWDGRAASAPADYLGLIKSALATATETLWSQRYDAVSNQYVLEDEEYGTAPSSLPSHQSPPATAPKSSPGLLGLVGLRAVATTTGSTNSPNHDPPGEQQQQQHRHHSESTSQAQGYYNYHQHQQGGQYHQQVFVANLDIVTSTAVAGINSSGGGGGAAATPANITPTTTTSAVLLSPFTSILTPVTATATSTATDTREVHHAATSFQLQTLPSAPLLPPPLLPYSLPHDSPLRRLRRPRTAPPAGLPLGSTPSSVTPLPPPPGGHTGTVAPKPLGDSNGAPAATPAPVPLEAATAAVAMAPGGGSFGTADLQLALAPNSFSSTGGGGGGRGIAGQGTVTGLTRRTLSDMPGLDLRAAAQYIMLSEVDPATLRTMPPGALSAATGSGGGFLYGGSGGSGIAAAAGLTAAAAAAGISGSGGDGGILLAGSGGSGIAAGTAAVAPATASISGSCGGSGGGPMPTALAAAERELGLIRVSSLNELSGQLEGLRWLASGSSGRVFTALWGGSMVAVKVVISATQDQLRDSSREALLSRVVSHPAICQCYTVCSECITAEHLQVPKQHGQDPVAAASSGGSGGGPRSCRAACSISSCSMPTDMLGTPLPSLGHSHMAMTRHMSAHVRGLMEPGSPPDGGSGAGGSNLQGWKHIKSFEVPPPAANAAACEGFLAGEPPHTLYGQQDYMLSAEAQDDMTPSDCAAATTAPSRQSQHVAAPMTSDGAVWGSGTRAASQSQTAPPGAPCLRILSCSGRSSRSSLNSTAIMSARGSLTSCGGGGAFTANNSSVVQLGVREELEGLRYGRGPTFSEHIPTGLAEVETKEKGMATAGCCSDGTAAAVSGPCGGGNSVMAAADRAVCNTTAAAAAVANNNSNSNFPCSLDVHTIRSGGGGGSTAISGGCSAGAGPAACVVSSLLNWNLGPTAPGGCGFHSPFATASSAVLPYEGRRCQAAAAAVELSTTLSLSELLRTYTPADNEDNNAATHSLPAALLSMGAIPGRYCTIVVLEWCNQGTLLQAIRNRPFNPERSPGNHSGLLMLLRTALEIAQGMRYLHCLGIVHGDLKPSNVLLQSHVPPSSSVIGGSSSAVWATDLRGFVAKVADFGLAMPAHHNSCGGVLRGGGGLLGGGGESPWGALAYLAPEVPEAGPSKKSDVYSYGCVLYHMCTGKQPFQGIRQGRLLVGLATGALSLQWPDNIYKVIRRLGEACCSRNPRDRPSFDKVVDALQRTISYVVRSPNPNSDPSRTSQEPLGSSTTSTDAEAAAEAAAAAAAWRSAVVGFGQFGTAATTHRTALPPALPRPLSPNGVGSGGHAQQLSRGRDKGY